MSNTSSSQLTEPELFSRTQPFLAPRLTGLADFQNRHSNLAWPKTNFYQFGLKSNGRGLANQAELPSPHPDPQSVPPSRPCCLARLPQLIAELQWMLIQSPSLCWRVPRHTNELR